MLSLLHNNQRSLVSLNIITIGLPNSRLKRRLHEQFFSLTSFPWQGKIARVDGVKWTIFPWQGKASMLAFPWQGKIVKDEICSCRRTTRKMWQGILMRLVPSLFVRSFKINHFVFYSTRDWNQYYVSTLLIARHCGHNLNLSRKTCSSSTRARKPCQYKIVKEILLIVYEQWKLSRILVKEKLLV